MRRFRPGSQGGASVNEARARIAEEAARIYVQKGIREAFAYSDGLKDPIDKLSATTGIICAQIGKSAAYTGMTQEAVSA